MYGCEMHSKISILELFSSPAVLRVYPSESSIAVSEGEREVEICANMVGLSERPIDIVLTTSDFSAMGESGLSFTACD